MSTTLCYRRGTLTSARVSTSYTVGATYRNIVFTSRAHTTLIPYTTTSCTTRSASRVCSNVRSTRASVVPAQVYTSPVLYHTQRTIYITNFVTLYSTSCTVSRRPAPTPTPTPTTKYITLGTTTLIIYPSQTTVDGPTDPTDSLVPILLPDGTPEPRKVPVGPIVGGVIGGLAAAALLGFLIYFLFFKKSKGHDKEDSREHLDHSRPLSIDGQSSPSEGSSGAFNPQMQEYGARYLNGQGPGYQYAHVRQDSMTGIGVAAIGVDRISPLSSPGPGTEQGYYHSQPAGGHYLGHAEIQDSRF